MWWFYIALPLLGVGSVGYYFRDDLRFYYLMARLGLSMYIAHYRAKCYVRPLDACVDIAPASTELTGHPSRADLEPIDFSFANANLLEVPR